ncbi:DUF2073 domain-containing protein [Candidatus Micrarchaeota archaeon]|nr:DUF2073 domain-containing protein [Candidatus Micrarchaeota archaeon]
MGVNIEFLAGNILKSMNSEEKIDYVLSNVRKDTIIVLEDALTPIEEKQLITQTMKSVSVKFTGIEVCTIGREQNDLKNQLVKILGGKASGLTIVGPSSIVKKIKRDPDKIRLLAGK